MSQESPTSAMRTCPNCGTGNLYSGPCCVCGFVDLHFGPAIFDEDNFKSSPSLGISLALTQQASLSARVMANVRSAKALVELFRRQQEHEASKEPVKDKEQLIDGHEDLHPGFILGESTLSPNHQESNIEDTGVGYSSSSHSPWRLDLQSRAISASRKLVAPKLTMLIPEYLHHDETSHVPDGSIARHVNPFFRGDLKSRTWRLWRRDAAETSYAYLCNSDGLPRTILLLHLLIDLVFLVTDVTLINTGLLEPPLRPTKVRLRWSSINGDTIFSDVEEMEQGGVAELVDCIERSSGAKVTASPYRQYAGNQQYSLPRPDRWLKNGIAKAASAFTKPSKPSPLPQHSAPCALVAGTSVTRNGSPLKVLHLMACIHRDSVRKYVQQDRVENISTDRKLLRFMRQKHVGQRKSIIRVLSLKRVKGIYFVKFWLPVGGSADVRHHNHCSDSCDCIPPPSKVEPFATAEYKCSPIPPKTRPPIPPEYLSMLFNHPSEVAENDVWVLNQIPKRTCGQLQGVPGQPAEGWGIYYHESWDRELITLAIFIVLVLATLLFGVLWSKYQFDVQGAFGVSAWMATLGGIFIALLVPQLEAIG